MAKEIGVGDAVANKGQLFAVRGSLALIYIKALKLMTLKDRRNFKRYQMERLMARKQKKMKNKCSDRHLLHG